jgi:hypothetical protein
LFHITSNYAAPSLDKNSSKAPNYPCRHFKYCFENARISSDGTEGIFTGSRYSVGYLWVWERTIFVSVVMMTVNCTFLFVTFCTPTNCPCTFEETKQARKRKRKEREAGRKEKKDSRIYNEHDQGESLRRERSK